METNLRAFVVLCITILCLLFWVNQCESIEVSIGHGINVPVESWQSDGLQCQVSQLKLSHEFKSPWYGVLVLDKFKGKINPPHSIDGKYFSGMYTGVGISARVTIQKCLFGNMYSNLFGGLGLLPKQMPEIGNSGMIGHFGAGVKYCWKKWRIGYEWIHTSDPLQHGDKGWNVQLLTFGYRF